MSKLDEVAAADVVSNTSVQSADLTTMMHEAAENAVRTETVSKSLNGALEKSLTLPGGFTETVSEREQISRSNAGVVGETKNEVISDVAREGVPEKSAEMSDTTDAITERFRHLYAEMTNWQVAWSIAQRAQHDTSHLLKGQ